MDSVSCTHEETKIRRRPRIGQQPDVVQRQCVNEDCLEELGKPVSITDFIPETRLKFPRWVKKPRTPQPTSHTRHLEEFRNSPAWRGPHGQRQRVLERDEFTCQSCEEIATDAAHKRYADPIEETPDDWIVSLCQSCHRALDGKFAEGP